MAAVAAVNSGPLKTSTLTINPLCFYRCPLPPCNVSFPFCPYFIKKSHIFHAKKRSTQLEPVLNPTIIEEEQQQEDEEEEDGVVVDDFEDGALEDGDDIFAEYEIEETELYVGDGGGGGGILLAGTMWDKKALTIAEDVLSSFDGDLKIYAFKTLANSTIQIRIEKLSNRSGSPSMTDIESFSSAYRARLDEAAGTIPDNVSLEVSSPGVERVVQIPQELDRFKDRPMYVKYISETTAESDGVFRLVSFDLESSCCTWGLADVKINREKAGKGRSMNKKQREWRLNTSFHSLRLVRLYSDI